MFGAVGNKSSACKQHEKAHMKKLFHAIKFLENERVLLWKSVLCL